jgi:phospholipid/cholesterol/gamma-HCH transport system substrate-binding protein
MKSLSAGIKVGILVILMVVAGYLVWTSLVTDPAGSGGYWLKARFKDASGLPTGSKVVVAGIPVGEILSTSIEGRKAVVRFKLRKDLKVFDSAVVFKKATSLLGNYYIEVDPGDAETVSADGSKVSHVVLKQGEEIMHVVEATSPDQLLRRIEQSLPNVDEVLKSVRDLAEDLRRLANGPVASMVGRLDALVQKEAPNVEAIVEKAGASMDRIDSITKDIKAITGAGRPKVNEILDKLDRIADSIQVLVSTTQDEIGQTGDKIRDKLDQVDAILANTEQITKKINEPEGGGSLARILNDPTIADNVEDITDDANSFLGTIFNVQTYVGLRSEYNVFSKGLRHYVSVELHTRPDKYYLIELEKGPRGGYPDVKLTFDPTVDPDNWIRTATIEDEIRFTFQFAKRFNWLTLRYGLKESTGGIGADVDLRWWNRSLKASVDVFDATFDQLPRVKLTAAIEVMRYFYVLGGVDELLNTPDSLTIRTGNDDVPVQFEELRFGRDYFVGAMLRFNDEDLAALLAIGGSAISGAAR